MDKYWDDKNLEADAEAEGECDEDDEQGLDEDRGD